MFNKFTTLLVYPIIFASALAASFLVFAAAAPGDLLGHWALNDGSGVIASDSSGNGNNGVLTNGPIWNSNELLFDGNNDYVNIGTLDVSGSDLTLLGWAQSDNLGNCSFRDCRIVSKATGVSEQDHYWMIGTIKVGTTTRLRFRLKSGGVTSTLVASSGNISNGDVFHVAAVYDGTTMRLYKDGIEVGSLAKTGVIDTNPAVEAWIGGNPTVASSRPWDGSLADVQLYQTALTAAEINTVKDSYDIVNVAPTVDAGIDQTVILPNGSSLDVTLDATVSDDGLPLLPGSVTTLWTTISGSNVKIAQNDRIDTTVNFSEAGVYVLNLAADDGEFTHNDQITITVSTAVESSDLVGHWELNDGSGVIANDSSSNAYNGTLINGPIWNGTELLFDGTNDYVNIGTLDVPGSTLTLASWAQTDNLENCPFRDCRILSKATGTSEQAHYWMIGTIKVGTTTRLRFRLKAGGVTSTLIASSGNISNSDVFHVAAVYDGSTMRLYKDGVVVGSLAKTGAIDTNAVVEAWIGANPLTAGSRPWNGSLSDIRVYQTALSTAEVNTIKNSYNVENVAPTVDAGIDQTITLANNTTLAATVSDDGLPTLPGTVTTLWTVLTGPGTVTFANDAQVGTTASFSQDGVYVLNLTADDGDLTINDQVTITVDVGTTGSNNEIPIVDAGVHQTITLPNDAILEATVIDDGLPLAPGSVTTLWTFTSGPGSVTFADASLVDTTASFSLAGVYVLDLAADDGEFSTSDQITITVNAVVTSSDLLGHWELNDASGIIAGDSSGNSNNGILTNGPSWNDTELLFDGNNDFVNLGTLDVSGSALTLTGWVQTNNLENCPFQDCRILSKATGTSEQDHFWMISTLKVGSTTRLRFRLKAGGVTSTLVASSGNINNGDIFHVAAVYDGNTMRLYKDGIEVGSLPKTGAIYTNTGVEAWIGANPTVANSRPWNGSIANVRVYKKSLTPAEVITIMNADKAADITAPNISNRRVTTTATSATITWNTHEAADSSVSYGTNNAYENGTVSNGSPVVSHSLTLAGLTENTTYHFQLKSTDSSGNTATSNDFTFVTRVLGAEPELLMFDWNAVITEANHGFPRDLPPLASANKDWTTPINYADGTLYIRAEITTGGQPVPQMMRFNFCVWQTDLVTGNNFGLESCVYLSPSLEGIVGNELTWSQKINDMPLISDDPLDWTRARYTYGVAIKNLDKNPVSDYGGRDWHGEDPTQWYPLNMRFTVAVVPNGQTFSGWDNYIY